MFKIVYFSAFQPEGCKCQDKSEMGDGQGADRLGFENRAALLRYMEDTEGHCLLTIDLKSRICLAGR
jgi:hypothetical protein